MKYTCHSDLNLQHSKLTWNRSLSLVIFFYNQGQIFIIEFSLEYCMYETRPSSPHCLLLQLFIFSTSTKFKINWKFDIKKKWNWIVLMDQYYVCSMCLYEKLLKNKTIWMHIKLFGLLICHVLAPVAIRGSWSLLSETMINLSHFGLIGNHTNMKYERWLWTDVQQRTSQTTESIPAHWIVKIFVWNHWTVYKQYHWY